MPPSPSLQKQATVTITEHQELNDDLVKLISNMTSDLEKEKELSNETPLIDTTPV